MLPGLNAQDFELTLEQQFAMTRYSHLVHEVSAEELRITLLEIARQLMVKDNLIKSLIKVGM